MNYHIKTQIKSHQNANKQIQVEWLLVFFYRDDVRGLEWIGYLRVLLHTPFIFSVSSQ